MSDEKLNLIDQLGKTFEQCAPGERLVLLQQLLKLHVGAQPLRDFEGEQGLSWCLPFSFNDVAPNTTLTFQAQPHIDFVPRRLILLEPTITLTDTIQTLTDQPVYEYERRWFRTRRVEIGRARVVAATTQRQRVVTVPRSSWRIKGMFVGQRAQLSMGDVSGDQFGPDAKAGLFDGGVCSAAIGITVMAAHTVGVPVPFCAIVVGRLANEADTKADAVGSGK